jgi:menaquinone-dependent protoporphyrinogen oxidase
MTIFGGDEMNHLVVYCSSHGTTAKAALFLRKHLNGEVIVLNLNRSKLYSDLDIFDSVIIGGSIHAGSIQGKIKRFLKQHGEVLKGKKLGLFLCCMQEGELAQQQFEHAFPRVLREHATATGIFGGEILFSEFNFIEKQIVKKVTGLTEDASNLDESAMLDFLNSYNRQSPMNSNETKRILIVANQT